MRKQRRCREWREMFRALATASLLLLSGCGAEKKMFVPKRCIAAPAIESFKHCTQGKDGREHCDAKVSFTAACVEHR
jgi:hypothetical protein